MIPVANPIPTPPLFDQDCRKPGLTWLRANRTSKKFPSHWRNFQPDLADGFHNLCGWWAMRIADGAVDHYLSKENHRRLTYSCPPPPPPPPTVNSSKKKHDDKVLDPFEVQAGWFEVLLPSLQLVRTALVPPLLHAKADFTLKKLKLATGPKVRRNRKGWYEDHRDRGLPMPLLEEYAPLVADAVKKWIATGQPLP